MKIIKTNTYLYGRFRGLKVFSPSQKKEFKKYVITTILSRLKSVVKNKHTGILIKIGKNGLKHGLGFGAGLYNIKSVTVIDKVLATAFLMDVSIDKHRSQLVHYVFRNLINIDGEIFFITLNVKQDKAGNFYYHHELTDIKKPKAKVEINGA